MWYKKYKKLNSSLFVYENSGKRKRLPPPYTVINDNDFNIIDIQGKYGIDEEWKIIGYSESFTPKADYPAVAIMFENTYDFEKVWFHYNKY